MYVQCYMIGHLIIVHLFIVVGFSGNNCETEVNECGTNPCKNGGMCQDLVNDFKCMCLPESGYTGKM
jgi:hypothetical protein